jgi:thiamine monophosphate kinase
MIDHLTKTLKSSTFDLKGIGDDAAVLDFKDKSRYFNRHIS